MVKVQKNSRMKSPDKEYLQALRLYWQNEKEGALALISERLADSKQEQPHYYYRLWIEVLADTQDEGSLRLLQRHIQRTIDYKHPSWIGFYALLGLIHYELGELEASRIVQRKLQRHTTDPYNRELALVLGVELEHAERLQIAKAMMRGSSDYFVLRRAALVGTQAESDFRKKALSIIAERIGESPLDAEVGFHKQFSMRQFRKAWQFARYLRETFPLNSEYQFYFAYTSYLIDRNRTALEEFLKLNRRAQEEDPDVLCMIGATLLQGGRKPMSEKLRKRSEYYLEKARHRLKSQGLPTDYPQELLLRLHEEEEIPNSGRHWIVKLSPKQCYDLYHKPEHRIEYLHRAMGSYVKAGDICMFVSESRVADQESVGIWRLAAIYKAISNPEWHPVHRWQTALKLQIRMEVSIPLEIEGNQEQGLPKQGPHRYGLYEIDNSAMVWIEDSVRSFTLDDQSFAQVFADLKLARSV